MEKHFIISEFHCRGCNTSSHSDKDQTGTLCPFCTHSGRESTYELVEMSYWDGTGEGSQRVTVKGTGPRSNISDKSSRDFK